MKTKEVVDKYKKILCPLLKCKEDELKFYVMDSQKTGGVYTTKELNFLLDKQEKFQAQSIIREIKEVEYFEPEKDKHGEETGEQIRHTRWNNWSEGLFAVSCKGELVSSFQLYKMPHCCAILVSCRALVTESFRNKRVGTILNTLRQDIGRLLGYSLLMCTDIEQNVHQRQLLKTNGWKDIYDVVNKRTKNRVFVSVINL